MARRWSSRSGATGPRPVARRRDGGRAGRRRAAPRSSTRRRRSATSSPRSTPACARRWPGWGSAPRPRTSAASCSRRSSSTTDVRDRAASRRRPHGPAGSASPTSPSASSDAARPRSRSPRDAVEQAPGPGLRPVPRRRRGPPLRAEDRRRDPGGVGLRAGRAGTAARRAPRRRPAGSRVRRPSSATLFRVRRPRGTSRPIPLAEVEPARSIARRFVVSAMSVGALSPEAHQALTIGIQRAGGAANTGEGGEDPGWYVPGPDGERHDARIKQVASARFGVTATYLARGEQLEIKIAQGSKPGEGGQLPAKKATAWIAALRRGQPGMSYISPPPHHDIYSIEDLAQLIADLRAINPSARIGVKLVASRGVGTIAAGVAKAGATYVHLAGPQRRHRARRRSARSSTSARRGSWAWPRSTRRSFATGSATASRSAPTAASAPAATCSSPRSSAPRSSRSAPRCSSRSAATWPASATSTRARPGSRRSARTSGRSSPGRPSRSSGSPSRSPRASGVELAAVGAREVGELVGESRRFLAVDRRAATLDLARGRRRRSWGATPERRARARRPPAGTSGTARRARSSGDCRRRSAARPGSGPTASPSRPPTARSGPSLTGRDRAGRARRADPSRAARRGRPVVRRVRRDRASSSGSSARRTTTWRRACPAASSSSRPEPDLAAEPHRQAIAGNTCLYGATGGRLHVVGRAGMRFAVRNSGRDGGRRGPRAARLRVHDRRRGRRARPGRRQLRGGDDRRPGLPVRPRRPPPRGARRA